MTHFIERKIVRDLAAVLIAAGMPVTVDHPSEDGSELEASSDLDAIEKAAFEFVDGIWLLVSKASNGKYDSWVKIVFGNEFECISDYSTDLQDVIQPVIDWCENPVLADAPAARTEDEKIKRVGRAVVQLESELIAEGKQDEASALVAAFVKLPPKSMATLHDLLA